MLKGIHLTLMIGPVIARPVSEDVLEALQSVKVMVSASRPTAFELTFSLNNRSPLHTVFLLSGGSQISIMRVILVVTINGTPNVLVDGVITQQQVAPGSDAGHSTLTVTGQDLTAVMDLIDFSGIPYPASPPEARVALVLAKYAVLGIIPKIIPSIMLDVPLPTQRIPRHIGKDLAYVKKLADDVGYVFYLEPGPRAGMSVAYWGPEIKVGVPQPALNINMDAHTNVESLAFRFDGENRKLPVVMIHNPETHAVIPIPIPDITPLNPPLGAIPPIPKGIEPITNSAKLTPLQAVLIGLAKAAKSSNALSATGSLNVLRYGRLLEPRKLVGVRGAGDAFDGLYYVDGVTHDIKRGQYTQQFTLSRNGLISTVNRVPA